MYIVDFTISLRPVLNFCCTSLSHFPSHARRLRMSKPKLYTAWFCPFAQRAWIGLLAKNVDFEYVEQDPYNKTPEWLAINPRGLVPTIVHNGKSIYDSPVCLEYTDEVWQGKGTSLLPTDSYERAYVRIWSGFVSSKLVPPFYKILMKPEGEEREAARQAILKNLLEFTKAMDPIGPFFMGPDLGFIDIMYAPWAARMFILKHYRGFEVPKTTEYERYWKWWEAVKENTHVKATLQDEDKLLKTYERYADGTAKSLVADAVRKGEELP